MRDKELFAFIKERYTIWQKKEAGKPKPWTKDPILQQYKFCNVYREHDTVTKWVIDNYIGRHAKDPHLWFALCVARLFNWPPTLARLEPLLWPEKKTEIKWQPQRILKELQKIKQEGEKMFSAAYIVSTNGRAMSKPEYVVTQVLDPMWKFRGDIKPLPNETLQLLHETYGAFLGMGNFMAGQVIADLKQAHKAPDWWTWAASGPGSRRGLNRVMDREITKGWREKEWLETLQALGAKIAPKLEKAGMPRMCMQNLQNCLCEFDKYERTRLGEGRPKVKYQGV